ncbi:uncharacterized protein DUF4173 [Pseudonocardia sediminis]|uniref:Uncharacterized protein DUF4173 n=2 Tax=Pseudonocardia sediminis TaxID=1397368 RepID=A0A4Q7V4L8_PSEST|nr:uncharacterized protein DUF4173 [Pseudonocardia sediminis]
MREPGPPLWPSWPAPGGPPSSRVLQATALAGLAGAVTLPGGDDDPGLGFLLAALAVAAAVVVVGWRPHRAVGAVLPQWVAVAESLWLPAAVALAAVPLLRDADWLVVLCLLAAVGAGSLAMAGRAFRSVLRGATAVPVAALRSPAWLGRSATGLRRTGGGFRLLAALLVGIGLLAVFAPLLGSADPVFGRVLDALVPTVDGDTLVSGVVRFVGGAAAVLGSAFLLARRPVPDMGPARPSRLRSAEWTLPVAMLVVLFALFVAVSLTTLFGSDDHVRATTGLTYAEYARSGFWQLLAVSVLTLVVVVAGARHAPLRTPADRFRTRLLLGGLSALTLVIVASALHRMWLYQQAYGFTVLRLLVLLCELWLALCLALMLVSVLRLRPDRPLRGMAAAGAAALLALAVLNPERFVAEQDVARYAATGEIDVGYLSGLSADAVPALVALPEPIRSCVLAPIADRLGPAEAGGWRSTNVSRDRARDLLGGVRLSCPPGARP